MGRINSIRIARITCPVKEAPAQAIVRQDRACLFILERIDGQAEERLHIIRIGSLARIRLKVQLRIACYGGNTEGPFPDNGQGKIDHIWLKMRGGIVEVGDILWMTMRPDIDRGNRSLRTGRCKPEFDSITP